MSSSSAAAPAGRGARVLAAHEAALTAWQPAAWGAAFDATFTAPFTAPLGNALGGAFTPGLDVAPAAGAARRVAANRADAGPGFLDELPDFGAAGNSATSGAATAAAVRRACEAAADAREAELRAEFEAAWAAEADARAAQAAADAEAAYQAGVVEGHAMGVADARGELAAAAGAIDAAATEVRAHAERWTTDLEAHVAALAVAVARHVIGREAAAGPELVGALVARAVAEFPVDQALAARVHPADLPALKAAWAGAERGAELRWIPDANVVRGGALVEGRERIVDGRVDAALERVYRALSRQQA